MKIEDLTNRSIKISRTSITCKDDSGKTCGVVTGVTKFTDLRPNKQMKYFKQLRDCGLWGSRIDGIMNCVVEHDGNLYYLHDLRPVEFYETYKPPFKGENKHYEQRKLIADKAAEYFTVIPCYVI